ncbi:MAG: hypothetical protein E7604_05710 [Ruminococcaceae bacterium]|nr:hypothetical protein [Oscillospiraceae bacterium]
MIRNTKSMAALLACLLTASVFTACGASDTGTQPPVTEAPAVSADTTAEPSEPLIDWTSAGIDPVDYNGDDLHFIVQSITANTHAWFMMDPEETNGEVLNDAIFDRNAKIEELFNIKITSEYNDAPHTMIKKAVSAGDSAYDATLCYLGNLSTIGREGNLYNWYDLPKINLEAEWWDQSMIAQLTLMDQLYACSGAISPALNIRCFAMLFNKDMCSSLGIEMPYQYVLDGTWTLDRFKGYVTDINSDINGDGVMDYEDRWGFFSEDGNSYMYYCSNGGSVVAIDGDTAHLSFNSVRNVELATEAIALTINPDTTLRANKMVDASSLGWTAASNWFAEGNALIRSTSLEPIPRDFRALDVNFGIIPYPKLDESQESYGSMADNVSGRVIGVPITSDAEYVSTILEVLAAESVNTVSTAFYDRCLDGKIMRDEESAAMLDIIFENKIFDLGLIFNIGTFKDKLVSQEKKGSTDVTSLFASIEKVAQKNLEKLLADYEELAAN